MVFDFAVVLLKPPNGTGIFILGKPLAASVPTTIIRGSISLLYNDAGDDVDDDDDDDDGSVDWLSPQILLISTSTNIAIEINLYSANDDAANAEDENDDDDGNDKHFL